MRRLRRLPGWLNVFIGVVIGFVLMQAILHVVIAHAAETVVWDEGSDGGVPKGVVGYDGARCTAESSNGEITYRTTFYIGADAGMMASDPKRERNWQAGHCQYVSDMMHGWFWDKRGLAHQPVKITVEGV